MATEKFTFTPDWQLDLINFITSDRNGAKALDLVLPDYFTLLPHAIIVEALKRFNKKEHRVPGKTMLKEELLSLFRTRDYVNVIDKEERKEIIAMLDDFYTPVRDGDLILDGAAKWASYVELKSEIESIDLLNFEAHSEFSQKVMKAIQISTLHKESAAGTLLIADIEARQLDRQSNPTIVPTPFRQINRLTNAGGYDKGGIIVILDRPKRAKTMTLVNIAKGYLRAKKKIFVVDMENGQDSLAMRFEQSIAGVNKKDLLSGKYDRYVKKVLRKYRRLGGEIYIKRFPAHITTTATLQKEMDLVYQLHGIKFTDIIIDYPALMGAMSGADDDVKRISDIYLDISSLLFANDMDHCWAAHHVVRAAEKRMSTVYQENDIAKCIDIVRHVQAVFGLNRSEYEEEHNIMRMELVVQRDGVPHGRALFNSDPEIQRIDEMTHEEIKIYHTINEEMVKGIDSGEFKGDL